MAALAPRNAAMRLAVWYASWAIPGLGMFSVAYIIFSSGQIGVFQHTMWPTCYTTYSDCDRQMVLHVSGYIQICGIMAGMLLWGGLGDVVGRKWGSRCVAAIMLSGSVLLTFTPWATTAYGYFVYFMVSQTWYGFGVGGEYPLAASSAAELSSVSPALASLRGRQVILVFSNQGMGNLANACVLAIGMLIFGQTQAQLTFVGSRNVLALMYGFGAFACLVMVLYRWTFLEESEMFEAARKTTKARAANEAFSNYAAERRLRLAGILTQLQWYSPRLLVASSAWACSDFAFYGNKLFQSTFIGLLYPQATPYQQAQWNILNSAVALVGYYTAAWLVDKPWYGRRVMQTVGFLAMFVLYLISGVLYTQLTTSGPGALRCFQFMYYFSSFWNQFGPNATTWLVAGEMFPTGVRSSYHGFNAAMGKVGAVTSALWFSYVSHHLIFLLSAAFSITGALVTALFLADTTGLELHELDRMDRCILLGRFADYHGEAVNPRHLSLFEWGVLRRHRHYDPLLDAAQREQEANCKPQAAGDLGGLGLPVIGV